MRWFVVWLVLAGVAQAQERDEVRARAVVAVLDALEDRRLGSTALEAAGRVGPEAADAVPVILAAWEADDSAYRRRGLAKALAGLGPSAAPAIPTLLEGLEADDANLQKEAALALCAIGVDEGGVAERVLELEASDYARAELIAAVGGFAPVRPEVRARLFTLCQDGNQRFRRAAAEALAQPGMLGVDDLPTVVEALGTDDDYVAQGLLAGLAQLGPEAAPALETVTACLARSQAREAAARCLGAMGEAAAPSLDALLAALGRGGSTDALQAMAQILMGFGEAGRAKIVAGVFSSDREARNGASTALRYLGERTVELAPALAEGLGSEDRQVRSAAMNALIQVGAPAAPSVSAWVTAPSADTRQAALQTLQGLGDPSPETLAALGGCLADPERNVRGQAAIALGSFGAASVAVLSSALNAEDEDLRQAAARGFSSMRPLVDSAYPVVVELLGDEDSMVRSTASSALVASGEASLPWLEQALRHEAAGVRAYAAQSLGSLRAVAAPTTPALIEGLSDDDRNARAQSARALGEVAPCEDAVLQALLAVVEDSSHSARREALEALGKVLERGR